MSLTATHEILSASPSLRGGEAPLEPELPVREALLLVAGRGGRSLEPTQSVLLVAQLLGRPPSPALGQSVAEAWAALLVQDFIETAYADGRVRFRLSPRGEEELRHGGTEMRRIIRLAQAQQADASSISADRLPVLRLQRDEAGEKLPEQRRRGVAASVLALLRSQREWKTTGELVRALCAGSSEAGLRQAVHVGLRGAERRGEVECRLNPYKNRLQWRWIGA